MRGVIGRIAIVFAALALASTSGGLIFSKWYWGYWMRPPTVVPWLRELTTVESISATLCQPDVPTEVGVPVSAATIAEGARAYRSAPVDLPAERGLAALADAGILSSPGTVSQSDAQAICDATQASPFLVTADPGYPYGRRIFAFVAIGRDASGQRLAIVSAKSGELSNDHYGLYDVRFAQTQPSRWQPTRHYVYFEDIAGIEGMRWWVAAIYLCIAGTLLTLALAGAFGLFYLATRVTRLANR